MEEKIGKVEGTHPAFFYKSGVSSNQSKISHLNN
jgi:hypothetical protein